MSCCFLASKEKPKLSLLCSLNFLLQDAPLSDCTETIEGLDPAEQASSPAKPVSVRKVLTALPLCSECRCLLFSFCLTLICDSSGLVCACEEGQVDLQINSREYTFGGHCKIPLDVKHVKVSLTKVLAPGRWQGFFCCGFCSIHGLCYVSVI